MPFLSLDADLPPVLAERIRTFAAQPRVAVLKDEARIRLAQEIDGRKQLTGDIAHFDGDRITVGRTSLIFRQGGRR